MSFTTSRISLCNASPVKHQSRWDMGNSSQKSNNTFSRFGRQGSPEKKFPAPIRSSPSKHSSNLARRNQTRQQQLSQDSQQLERKTTASEIQQSTSNESGSSNPLWRSDHHIDDPHETNKSENQQSLSNLINASSISRSAYLSYQKERTEQEHQRLTEKQMEINRLKEERIQMSGTENKSSILINNNHYTILNQIGKGGSSIVYQALDKDNHMKAIKKVDLSQVDQKQKEDFINEIRHLQKLKGHQRIIELFGWEVKNEDERQTLFVVMEYGEKDLGRLLKELCSANDMNNKSSSSATVSKRRGDLTGNKIKFYWEEMLEAVQVIHQEGIVHRDLKPGNFVIVGGRVKLIDFGIGKHNE